MEFAREVDGALAGKTLAASLRVESGRLQMAYTRRIEPADLDDLTGVDTTAHLFQRFLPKAFEARVTVVGNRVFAAAIHSDSDTGRVDWRADYDSLRYSVVDPPDSVITGMLAFMKQFGLTFGAFDFAVTPDQQWILFECNPAGAYGWIEDALEVACHRCDRRSSARTEPAHADLAHRPQHRRGKAGRGSAARAGRVVHHGRITAHTGVEAGVHPHLATPLRAGLLPRKLRSPEMVSAAEPEQRARWLSAVYSDQTLITRIIRVPAQNWDIRRPLVREAIRHSAPRWWWA